MTHSATKRFSVAPRFCSSEESRIKPVLAGAVASTSIIILVWRGAAVRLNCFARKLENTCCLVPLLLSIAALVSCKPSLAVAIAVTRCFSCSAVRLRVAPLYSFS